FCLSSRRRHTRFSRDGSADVCSSDLANGEEPALGLGSTPPRRIPGVVAEDLEAVGLDMFVTYNDDGETESVFYDRIGPALIPIIRAQRDRIGSLEERIKALETK